MSEGDIVMFTKADSPYAKWFFGHLGIVENLRENSKGILYCRVRWVNPVRYHEKTTAISSFSSDCFDLKNDIS